MQKIVNGHVNQTRVCAIEEALDQSNEKAAPTEPFEPWQDLREEGVHVKARRRQQGEDDTKQKRKRAPNRQRPSHDFYIQQIFLPI